MQEATTVAPPACEVVTAPALLTATVAGLDELQVKGTPVMVLPCVSTTVGVTVLPLPEVTLMELWMCSPRPPAQSIERRKW